MEKIKVLIVEDKTLIAEDIAFRLTKHSMEIVDICASGEEAIEKSIQFSPDLILMDIQLSGKFDGIETAAVINKSQNIPIIYLSDHTDSKTVTRAKKTTPANFLSKPFNEVDLIRAIDIAFSNAQAGKPPASKRKDVFLRTATQTYIKLLFDDILFLKAERAYCTVVTRQKEYILSTSMNHVNESLGSKDFVKVHRSYIININQITSLEGNTIKLGEHEVIVSKEFKDDFMQLLRLVK